MGIAVKNGNGMGIAMKGMGMGIIKAWKREKHCTL